LYFCGAFEIEEAKEVKERSFGKGISPITFSRSFLVLLSHFGGS